MLLIHHRQAEARERNRILDQRVGANHELRGAGGHTRSRFVLLLALEAASQPDDVHTQRFQPCGKLAVVLLGQEFGRRHQRSLPAGIDGLAGRQCRNDGLAAAHVALEQPLHRVRVCEVGADLIPHAGLRAGQLERQRIHEPREQPILAAVAQDGRIAHAARSLRPLERQLLRQQFIELDAQPRRVRALDEAVLVDIGTRLMQQAHGVGGRHQLERGERTGDEAVRQRFRQRRTRKCVQDRLAQIGLRHASGARIHRCQTVGQRFILRHRAHGRVHHLGAEETTAHFAAHTQAHTLGHLLDLAAVEVEKA